MYRDIIRVNVEKYCVYNGERKCSLKKEEYLDKDNDENISNKEKEKGKEKNKSFKVVA